MRRSLLLTAATTATLLLTATAALAHASLDVAELPAGSTTDVVMRVPLERQGVGNERVEILAPEGFGVEGCDEDAGWSCAVEQQGLGTVVSFTRGDGDEMLERFGFTLTAPDDEREDVLPTVQTYTDGEEVAWIGDGGDRPAPRVTVGPPDADVVANTDDVDDDPIDPDGGQEPETSAPADPDDETDPSAGDDDQEPETSAPADPDDAPDGAGEDDDADEPAEDVAGADDGQEAAEDDGDRTLVVLQVVALVLAVALVAAIALRRSGRLGG